MTQRIELGKFARILRGTTPAHIDETGQGPIFVGQTEVSTRGRENPRRVELLDDDRVSPVYLIPGDIVIASLDQSRQALFIDDSRRAAVLGRDCLAIRVEEGTWKPVSPEFIAVWMRTDDFRHQAGALATGTVMPRLTHRALMSVELPVFSSERQAEIVSLAQHFDDATTSVNETLRELEQLEAIEMELAFLEDKSVK